MQTKPSCIKSNWNQLWKFSVMAGLQFSLVHNHTFLASICSIPTHFYMWSSVASYTCQCTHNKHYKTTSGSSNWIKDNIPLLAKFFSHSIQWFFLYGFYCLTLLISSSFIRGFFWSLFSRFYSRCCRCLTTLFKVTNKFWQLITKEKTEE